MTPAGFVLLPWVILFAVVVIVAGVALVVWLVRASERTHPTESGAAPLDVNRRFRPAADLMPQPAVARAPARDVQFTYTTGDRPLDGYTIKRGIGRGGFGEVYYAMSDGGKEVALKLVQRHLDVELRGVTQCLNLKHPYLVTIYDVKQAANGDYWIVMEYLSGAGLSDVLAANQNGLPHDQAMAWLRGIAEGVGNLHEHGIVHRDLKPGNIFVENGIVKIGDYGLAKFISASRRSGQTESVGTVHYMAPEVAHGRYGKEIDLYALGVILYELLTGRVPFEGQSPGEIMMKHLTAQPDTSVLPEPYRAVVARLLAKDPSQRYPSVAAMLAELSGEAPPSPPVPIVPPVQQRALQRTGSWHGEVVYRPTSRSQRRHTLAMVIGSCIGFLATLAVVIVVYYMRGASGSTPATMILATHDDQVQPAQLTKIMIVTPIFLSSGFVIIVLMLLRRSRRALIRAARVGDISRVRLLLADGADVNARRWGSRSALIAAAEAGHIAVVEHLLERGADVNARLSDGETALSLAVIAGHAAVVDALLAAGADVNSRASNGDTPLIEAAYAGHGAILRKLIEHGGDLTARSGSDGSTPLIWAAYGGHTECVEALLERGANVNEKDIGDGSTPLIWAAYGNHPNVVRILLDHGADPNETNSSGETAFDHAESDTITALLEAAVARR